MNGHSSSRSSSSKLILYGAKMQNRKKDPGGETENEN